MGNGRHPVDTLRVVRPVWALQPQSEVRFSDFKPPDDASRATVPSEKPAKKDWVFRACSVATGGETQLLSGREKRRSGCNEKLWFERILLFGLGNWKTWFLVQPDW